MTDNATKITGSCSYKLWLVRKKMTKFQEWPETEHAETFKIARNLRVRRTPDDHKSSMAQIRQQEPSSLTVAAAALCLPYIARLITNIYHHYSS